MKKKFLLTLFTSLFLTICFTTAGASAQQSYNSKVRWYSEYGIPKAKAAFEYKKIDDKDIDMFVLELYKNGNQIFTTHHTDSWGGDSFSAEGIEQTIDLNNIIESYGNGTYTFRIGACSDTFDEFSQHWDAEKLNVIAWSDLSPDFVYTKPEYLLNTPFITSFANGTFSYHITDSSYIERVSYQIKLKTSSGTNSRSSSASYSSHTDFNKEQFCEGFIDKYNQEISNGRDAELTLSISIISSDVTLAQSSKNATAVYAGNSSSPPLNPPAIMAPSGSPLTYEISNNEAIVTYCDKDASGHIIIPPSFNNCPVTRIASMAFANCENISSVRIPDSVKSIGNSAFAWCTGLKNVVIPDSVKTMGVRCFWHCENLVELKLPKYIESVPYWTCEGCYSLEEIIIPETATFIGESAFKYCRALKKVTIPSSVKYLINGCFCYCEGLEEVYISYGAITLDRAVFSHCASLEKITLPHSLQNIGIYAFSSTPLKDVYYTGSVSTWNNIRLYRYNVPLMNAKIHYVGTENEQKELITPIVNTTETSNEYIFNVSTTEEIPDATLSVALYSETGKFLGVKSVPFKETSATVAINKNKNADSLKIFLWSSGLKPATTVSASKL